MKFHLPTAEIFVPDGLPIELALARTTHMCFAAHQDDIEIMAAAANPGLLPTKRALVYWRGRHRRARVPT